MMQQTELVCKGADMTTVDCDHLHQRSAVGTVVRLLENVRPFTFTTPHPHLRANVWKNSAVQARS